MKLKLHSRPVSRTGSYHTSHAQRHLTNCCNPDGRASITQLLEAKIKIKEENEEAVTLKAENIKKKSHQVVNAKEKKDTNQKFIVY